MDLILQDYSRSTTATSDVPQYDPKTVERYAKKLCLALKYSGQRWGRAKSTDRRPLFVGGREKRKAAPARLPGDVAPEYLEPQRKRERITGEVEDVAEEITELPFDLQFLIIIEALYPKDLLHLNQLAGRKETRSRSQFETMMYIRFRAYWLTFLRMKNVSTFFRDITLSPGVRERLYKRYMATPPEGLYERPDYASAVPESQFKEKVKIGPHVEMTNDDDRGQPTGLLRSDWYRDFLTTVLYNEWQRAISLSSARATQFYYWFSKPAGDYSAYRPEFLNYWGIHNQEELEQFRAIVWNPPDTAEFHFSKKIFPLTWDIDEHRIFGRHSGSISKKKITDLLWYQTFDQQNIKENYVNPEYQGTVIPTVAGLVNLFSKSRIELFRLLQFETDIDIGIMQAYGPGRNELGILIQSSAVSIHRYHKSTEFSDYKQYERLLGAVIVDPPYTMAFTNDYQFASAHSKLAFTPWHIENPVVFLDHIDPYRTSGLGGTLKAMKQSGLNPTAQFKLWRSEFWQVEYKVDYFYPRSLVDIFSGEKTVTLPE